MSRQPNRALERLAEWVPAEVLLRARDLAHRIEQDDYIRDYVARRGAIVAAVGMASTVCLGLAAMMLIAQLAPYLWPLPLWMYVGTVLVALAAWVAGTLLVMVRLLSAMERAALAARGGRADAGATSAAE